MNTKVKEVTIGHRELLDTIQIIHIMKTVNAEKEDVDEAMYLDSLIYTVLSEVHIQKDGCIVELDNETRFGIWLCLDTYKDFLIDCAITEDLDDCNKLLAAFGGPAE